MALLIDLIITLLLLLGAYSIGKLIIIIAMPKVKKMKQESKIGMAIIIGGVYSFLVIIISLLTNFILRINYDIMLPLNSLIMFVIFLLIAFMFREYKSKTFRFIKPAEKKQAKTEAEDITLKTKKIGEEKKKGLQDVLKKLAEVKKEEHKVPIKVDKEISQKSKEDIFVKIKDFFNVRRVDTETKKIGEEKIYKQKKTTPLKEYLLRKKKEIEEKEKMM